MLHTTGRFAAVLPRFAEFGAQHSPMPWPEAYPIVTQSSATGAVANTATDTSATSFDAVPTVPADATSKVGSASSTTSTVADNTTSNTAVANLQAHVPLAGHAASAEQSAGTLVDHHWPFIWRENPTCAKQTAGTAMHRWWASSCIAL